MRKFKIINYQPYEYELLQNQLDELGNEGYECRDISLFSSFTKTDHPVYYKIDFFKQIGTSRVEQSVLRERFFQPYIDHDYVLVSKSRKMYVFMGNKDVKIKSHHYDHITNKINFNYLSIFLLVVLTIGFLGYKIIMNASIDSFLTYGMTFVYLGGFVLSASLIYRTLMNFIMMNKFHQSRRQKTSLLQYVDLKTYRLVYKILLCLSFVMITGGLIEDAINPRSFSLEDHTVVTLADLSIHKESDADYKVQSSFLVPHTYTALEMTKDDEILYTKEYQFAFLNMANQFYHDTQVELSSKDSTTIEEKENILYCYTNKKLTTLVIKDGKNVKIVSVTFPLLQDQINKIVQH